MTPVIAKWMALVALGAGAACAQITTNCLPAALPQYVGLPVNVICVPSGGIAPFTWTISAGALPPGLTLDPSLGTISGSLAEPPGPYSFTVTATDSLNNSGSQQYSGTTLAPVTCTPATGPVEVGVPYSTACTAVFGTPPYTWSISSTGQIPPGLTISSAGNINYIPPTNAAGSYQYKVQATDSSIVGVRLGEPFTGTIAAPVGITTTSPLPAAMVGKNYSVQFVAAGGVAPYTWIATNLTGTGLGMTSGGLLSGTPTTAGPLGFNVTVMDSVGGTSGAVPFSLAVSPALTITNTSPLPAATVGTAYSLTFIATGGSGSGYTWSITGSLPAGLTLTATTGVVSGTPPANALTSTFTTTVTDSAGNAASGLFTLPVTLAITTTSPLPTAAIGATYAAVTLAAIGGAGGYTWSATGLPTWLTLSSAGVLSGNAPTPSTAVNTTVNVTVTDSAKVTANASLSLPVTLAITTPSQLPAATVNVPYSETFTAGGGSGGYTWSTTGSLPAGLTLSAAGVLSGTPTVAGPASLNITVADSSHTSVQGVFSLQTNPPLSIITSSPMANGIVGVAYNQTLTGTGGLPPYTWSVTSGALPGGLTLDGSTGAISGTPSSAAASTFTIQLKDSTTPAPNTTTKQFVITISAGLAITTASPLPNATVGVPYSQTLSAAGGAPPYSWAIASGTLPAGLTLNSATGAVSGTPAGAGTAAFTVTVTDSAKLTASQAFMLTVVTPPVITTASLPNASPGAPYSQTLAASGGTPPYKWAISAGALPAGLSLSTAGTIAGTPQTTGTASFTVQLTDSTGVTAAKALTLLVTTSLTISTTSPLPAAEVGIAYSQTLAAIGGSPPYTWSIKSGAVPSGLSLAASGILAGTPATAGLFNFTAQVTDSNLASASAAFALNVTSAVAILTPPALNNGSLNSSYSQSLTVTGGVAPYTWTVVNGALPPGLTLSAGGTISGVPTRTGSFVFTLQVADSLGAKASRQFTIVIVSGLTVTTPAILPIATVGILYSETLQASGGTLPYTWTLFSGSLPAGLSLSAAGVISGTPSAAGSASFTVQVTDKLASHASAQLSLTVATALSVSTAGLPGGALGASYSQTLAATGGTPPYSWSILNGALPGGLSLSTAGSITGKINSSGTFNFTAEVTDSAAATATRKLSITVGGSLAITTPAALPNASLNGSYPQTLAAAGGTPPYSWALTSGALPSGLSLSAAGAISGTPTATGTFTFTATVTDSVSATASQQFSLVVAGGLRIATASLPAGKAGTAYSQTLQASGGTPPYTFSKSAGSLPPGITLSGATLSGTPSAAGSFTFTIQVTDSASATATQQFTIGIGGLAITTAQALPTAALGTAYSQTLAAAGTPPYAWAVTQGALPGGLTIDSSSGTISGTPNAAGNFSFTVQVTDSTKATASAAFNVTVLSASFTGIPGTATTPQVSGTLALGAAYPAEITGQITLTFQPDASLASPSDDPSILFATGGRTLSFTLPANSTTPVSFALQTGTVAGTITLAVSWQAGGETLAVPAALNQTIKIAPAVPVISAVTAATTSSGFQVQITGYSNTREVSQAVLQFTPASGQTLQTTNLTVPLTSAAATWFQGSTSDQFGSQFILTLPFTVSNGSAGAIGSVSVLLVNSQGNSASATATP